MSETTYGTCACGCGDPITHEGSSYAGADEQERNRHRARAAYKRRQGTGEARPAGTREALAALGIADDVPISELASRVAAAMAELARRTAGVDSAAIQREIERGLAEARQQVEAAESAQAKATERAAAMAEELSAAVRRADAADEDAANAGERAEQMAAQLDVMTESARRANDRAQQAERDSADALRRADRAEAVAGELRTERDRTIAEIRRAAEADVAVKLAEQRAELIDQVAKLRTQLAAVTAERDAQRERADRAEGKKSPTTRTRRGVKPTNE